ncbi:hypothetical protein GCM10027416_17460 [Okibacterium endophyticum]
MASRTPETEVAIARAREEVARVRAELQRIDPVAAEFSSVSVRVAADLFVATPSDAANGDAALGTQLIRVADAEVVDSTPGSTRTASRHVDVHAGLYRSSRATGAVLVATLPAATARAESAAAVDHAHDIPLRTGGHCAVIGATMGDTPQAVGEQTMSRLIDLLDADGRALAAVPGVGVVAADDNARAALRRALTAEQDARTSAYLRVFSPADTPLPTTFAAASGRRPGAASA